MSPYKSEEVADVKPIDRHGVSPPNTKILERTPIPPKAELVPDGHARILKRSRSTGPGDNEAKQQMEKKLKTREGSSLPSLEEPWPSLVKAETTADAATVAQFSALQEEGSSSPSTSRTVGSGVSTRGRPLVKEKVEDVTRIPALPEQHASTPRTSSRSSASTCERPVVKAEVVEHTTQLSDLQEENPSSSSSSSSSGARTLERRPLVEIVLPTLKDVRLRQAASRQSAALAASVDVKMNPDQRELQPPVVPIGDVGNDGNHGTEALRNAVEQLRNPDAKVKKECQFSDEFLLGALGWEGLTHRYPISLPKEIAEYGFSRYYISNLYGGSTQTTFPKISDDRVAWHGLGDWAFLTLEFNPHAPTRPGHSGLFFSPRKAWDGWHGTQRPLRTFVRLGASKWVYMGQYRFVPGISLTSDEWKKQKDKVRSTWAYGVHISAWGSEVTLRVWFRKQRGADYEPTKEEYEDAALRMGDIRKGVTLRDMIEAYDQGEEEIGTYKMTCVEYDEEFVRVLERNAQHYVSPLINANKGAGKGKGTRTKRKSIQTRTKLESDED